jgi:hypothetical protein
MRTLRFVLDRLGAAGVLGVGVLLFCLPFYFTALRPAEREVEAKRAAAERQRAGAERPAGAAARPVSLDERAEELERFYALFPPVERLRSELERLYGLARGAGLELLQGDYRVEKRPTGLVAYRITLPVRGSYAQVRRFAGAVLARMPTASIDALRFERKKPADAQLDAQLRITVHFRPGRDAPGEKP